MYKGGVPVRAVSDKGLDSKIKLQMQTWDSLKGPFPGYDSQVTVRAHVSCSKILKKGYWALLYFVLLIVCEWVADTLYQFAAVFNRNLSNFSSFV